MDPPPGKSRARGRSRGQRPPEPARRPVDIPNQPPVPPGFEVPPVDRAIHGGGESTEVQPGESSLAAGVEHLQIGGASSGRGVMRGQRIASALINLRPTSCHDKRGSVGEPIRLLTNYVKVNSARGRDFIFYQYRVEYAPMVESTKMRRAMLFDHLDKIGRSFIFDGMEDLKTTRRLAEDTTILWSKRRSDDENIQISLKLTGELNGSHPEVLRLMNTHQRKNFLNMGFVALGRHHFDQKASIALPQYKLEIWPGFETAIRMHEESLLMVIDNINKVLRQDTVLDMMGAIRKENPTNYINICQRDLIGVVVMTNYNNKTYSLDDFDFTKTPRNTFNSSRTGVTTYVEYYKRQYNLEIRDLTQALIVCRPKERDFRSGQRDPVYLIPEFCVMTGLTDSMRKDFELMKDMAVTTRPDPQTRVQQIRKFINRCNSNEKIIEDMRNWGIEYGRDLIQLNGRILPEERIIQIPNEQGKTFPPGDFNLVMRERRLFSPKPLSNFSIISTGQDESSARDLYSMFRTVCGPMEMIVSTAEFVIVDQRMISFITACRTAKQKGHVLVVIIVPNQNKDRYDAIKKNCCIDHPIPSQVIVSRTLRKNLKSIATKIAIQINCKLGGAPWKIPIPFTRPFMIAGFDTYHDSSQRGRSAGALVATMNKDCTVWSSRISFHHQREELSDTLYTNMVSLLKKYYELNKVLPELLIFYRDGVSDGQLQIVKDHEIPQIYRAFETLNSGLKPRLVFIVVNKRISTRFFHEKNPRLFVNPPPGTIIDSVITRPERYDFYLISQCVRQGTVSPTQFNVIEDTSGVQPNHIQRVSYKLCHMYYNWQGTIRVPAPCQYAHKLAFLVGQSLHNAPSEQLSDKLYFL